MSFPIIVKYRWTTTIVMTAAKLHFKHGSPSAKIRRYLGIVLVLAFPISWFLGKTVAIGFVFPLSIMGVFFLFLDQLMSWITCFKFRGHPYRDSELRWTFTEESLSCETDGFNQKSAWTKVYSVLDTAKGFLIYPQKSTIFWIPFDGFENPSDIDIVREIAKLKAMRYANAG